MKRKNRILFLCLLFAASVLAVSCDMIMVGGDGSQDDSDSQSSSDGRYISDSERDELERNGRFLKLINMPLHTQVSNVYSVSVSNSVASVGKLDVSGTVSIYRETDSCSVYLPLVYNDNTEFLETGSFYTAFSVHVDAVSVFVVNASDRFVVRFTDGRGQADVNDLPSASALYDQSCLTVFNLPASVSVYNFSDVFIHNQAGVFARCADYSAIVLNVSGDRASAKIPLRYNSANQPFAENGVFFVSFDVNVDVETRYTVSPDDRVRVVFTNGNGYLDIQNIPDNPVPYLTVKGLPPNAAKHHISKVSVYNNAGVVANCSDYGLVFVLKDSSSSSFLIPLSHSSGGDFQDTGRFAVSFDVNIDAETQIIISRGDNLILSFVNGSAEFDAYGYVSPSRDPGPGEEPRYLTVYNLPSSVSIYNFSNVFVRNQAGVVAKCGDYSKIILSSADNLVTARIPLVYSSGDRIFTETGVFYVLFDINVDVETRYTLALDDKVKIPFVNGDGFLDIRNIPENPVPYLAIKGFPLNATKQQISNVSVYNLAGSVAGCSEYKDIVTVREADFLTFLVPLSYSDGGYFQDSGRFAVSFTVNVDVDIQIVYERGDNLILPFVNGSSEFDINSYYGFFDASLTNMNDSSRPVVKSGSSFDVNGNRCKITGNVTVTALAPNSSCVAYLYAYFFDSEVYFEFSVTAPVYNPKKRGWYNGTRRALWKMVYIASSSQFLYKTYIEDNFPQFGAFTLNIASDYSQLTAAPKPVVKSIDGSSNPASDTFTLDPGVYVVQLKGAGGGAGRNYNGTSAGGSGGLAREIFTLNSKTSFTAFTGSGGGTAPAVTTSGTFAIVATKNYYTQNSNTNDHGITVTVTAPVYHSTDTVVSVFSVTGTNNSMSGGGGGGGGSAAGASLETM